MKTSERGKSLIKRFEGLRLKAYRCPAGIWTIGYGHTGSDVREGMTISEEEADSLLASDLERFERVVSRLVMASIGQNRFDALVSFCYNVGEGNFERSTLLCKVNANPYDKSIYDEFKRWNKAGGKPEKGLTERRLAEALLYFEPWEEGINKT